MRESKYNQRIEHNGKKIIYNGVSKSSISVEAGFRFSDLIEENDLEVLSVLHEEGMLVNESVNELDTIRYLFNKYYFGRERFLNIVLVPSLDCNFRCPYCFERVKETDQLFLTNLDAYFSALKQYAEKNFNVYDSIEISLFGGEPLLFASCIFDFFEHLNRKMKDVSYFSSIVTNGALLDVEMTEKLLKYKCRSIQVTIDGWKKVHDENRIYKNGEKSYDRLLTNINEVVPILKEDCQFNLRINLNNVTPEEVRTTLSDIEPQLRNKIKVLFRPIYNTDLFKQSNSNKFNELKSYLDMAKEMGFDIVRNTYYYQACESCSGDSFYFIMPDLSLWKCINDLSFLEAKIGNIDENGEVHFDAEKLVKWYGYSNCFDDPKCLTCKMLPDCFGGCVLYRAKNGNRSCKEFAMAALPYLY